MLQLLDLPAEVLLMCLSHLSLGDLLACLDMHNLALSTLIFEAPAIQFRVEQDTCGVAETAHGAAGPLFARRAALREREERWRAFAPVGRRAVATRDVRLYDVGEDCYALAYKSGPQAAMCDRVEYMFLDGSEGWLAPEDITQPVVDICVVSEWDLLVVVTLSAENNGMRRLAAHLRQLSTGAVQAGLARTIELTTAPAGYGVPDLRVEVAGSTLAIAACFVASAEDEVELDLLHLIHWPSGRAFTDAVPCSLTSFAFVHDALLLVPNPHTHCLDVLALGADSYGWMLSFRLPALRPGHQLLWDSFDCRAQPTPHTHLVPAPPPARDLHDTPAQTRTPFRPDPEQALIVLMFDTATDADPADADVELVTTPTIVVIDRLRLRERFYAGYREQADGAPLVEVPFADWGPHASTWLDAGRSGLALSGYAVTGFVGTRLVALGEAGGAEPEGPRHVRVLDFNYKTVNRVRKQLDAAKMDVLEAAQATRRVRMPAADAEHGAFAEPLGAALGYVDITSREVVDWEGVHMSNACILGEKDSDVEGERELHVLYFG
ncbi:hypothetical protein MIND_00301600 [Mycena indigotica]|uniref:F-box domain-containing protein n=1 Tax=Mycena indigotica TaxID=2126181 RepID=A0A8H6T097_9AGAR|nr:uncharacterized protein MIND_00301600 [Mycena indigotica]KAF7309313.1 hypothetical protein MIND_00301600 [Mycena indigotica]